MLCLHRCKLCPCSSVGQRESIHSWNSPQEQWAAVEDQFQGWWWWRQRTKVQAVMWSALLIPNEGIYSFWSQFGETGCIVKQDVGHISYWDTGFLSAYKISHFNVRLKHSLTSSEEDEETFFPPKVLFFYLLVTGTLPLRCSSASSNCVVCPKLHSASSVSGTSVRNFQQQNLHLYRKNGHIWWFCRSSCSRIRGLALWRVFLLLGISCCVSPCVCLSGRDVLSRLSCCLAMRASSWSWSASAWASLGQFTNVWSGWTVAYTP